MYLPTYICSSLFLPGLSPSLFSFFVLKLKGSGVVFAQNKACVELLACLARQAFEDGRSPGGYQITDIVFGKERAADFTEDMEVAAFVPAFGNLGIEAHTFVAAFRTAVYRIGLLL